MLLATRYLIISTVVFLLLLAGVYLASPWLIGVLAPRLAETLGVDSISVTVRRPGLGSIEIESFRVSTAAVEIQGSSGALTFEPLQLLGGKLQSLHFATVAVTVDLDTARSDDADTADSPEALLPQAVFAAIPVATLTIDALTLALPRSDFVGLGSLQLSNNQLSFRLKGLRPAAAEHFMVEGEMDSTGTVHARFLDTNAADRPFLVVDSSVEAARVAIDASFNLTGYALQLAAEFAGIPRGEGTSKGEITTELPWPITDTSLEDLVLHGTFDVKWQDADEQLRLRDLRGRFDAERNSVAVVLEGGYVEIGGAALSLEFPPDYPVTYRDGVLTMDAGMTFTMAIQDVTAHGKLRSLKARVSAVPNVDIDTDLTLSRLDLTTSGRAILQAELQSGGELLIGKGTLMLSGTDLPATFNHHFAEGRGSLSSNLQITITTPLLASVFESWVAPYDVTAGQITVAMDLAWDRRKPIAGSITVAMSGVNGAYDEYLFGGANGDLLLRVTEDGIELTPSSITIERADAGLVVTDVSLLAAWQGDILTVTDMEMRLLGGRAAFSPIKFDREQATTAIDVALEGLDLAEVLALEGEHVAGTGVLNGHLPIRITNGLASMTNGQLAAEPQGGTIRLAPSLGAVTGQPGLDFTLQALTNFRYSKLETTADYAENGDLSLAVSLQGMNPEVEKGRPILYNLTINENILALLESLRTQRAITDRVERRVLKTEG